MSHQPNRWAVVRWLWAAALAAASIAGRRRGPGSGRPPSFASRRTPASSSSGIPAQTAAKVGRRASQPESTSTADSSAAQLPAGRGRTRAVGRGRDPRARKRPGGSRCRSGWLPDARRDPERPAVRSCGAAERRRGRPRRRAPRRRRRRRVAAWDRTAGPSTVVADLDSGYRFDAPDLAPVAWTNPADPANGVDDDGNGIVDDIARRGLRRSDRSTPRRSTATRPTTTSTTAATASTPPARSAPPATTASASAASRRTCASCRCASAVLHRPGLLRRSDDSGARASPPRRSRRSTTRARTARGRRTCRSAARRSTRRARRARGEPGRPVRDLRRQRRAGQRPAAGPALSRALRPARASRIAGAIDNVICVAATDQADGLAASPTTARRPVDVGAPGTDPQHLSGRRAALVRRRLRDDDFGTTWLPSGRASAPPAWRRTADLVGMTDSPGAVGGEPHLRG